MDGKFTDSVASPSDSLEGRAVFFSQQGLGQRLLFHCCLLLLQILYISDVVNRSDYVPRNPGQDHLSNVFDTRFSTVQPYLHRVMMALTLELSIYISLCCRLTLSWEERE